MSNVLAVLAEPRRLEILRLVWNGERAAGEIAREMSDVTFGAVSQHLRVLQEAHLVTVRREGRFRHYRANRETLGPLADYLAGVWAASLTRLKESAERSERSEREERRSGRKHRDRR